MRTSCAESIATGVHDMCINNVSETWSSVNAACTVILFFSYKAKLCDVHKCFCFSCLKVV